MSYTKNLVKKDELNTTEYNTVRIIKGRSQECRFYYTSVSYIICCNYQTTHAAQSNPGQNSELTLWGPRNEIKEKTLHFIRKTNLNTIQIIIFITKDKKNYNLLQNLGGFTLKPLGLQNFF